MAFSKEFTRATSTVWQARGLLHTSESSRVHFDVAWWSCACYLNLFYPLSPILCTATLASVSILRDLILSFTFRNHACQRNGGRGSCCPLANFLTPSLRAISGKVFGDRVSSLGKPCPCCTAPELAPNPCQARNTFPLIKRHAMSLNEAQTSSTLPPINTEPHQGSL